MKLEAVTTLELNLKICNTGNSSAKLIGYIYTDTTSGRSLIRDIILNKTWDNRQIAYENLFYYDSKELGVLDTIMINFSIGIQYREKENSTLHFLFLYFGENGVLYDTYYWARYKMSDFIIRPDTIFIKGNQFKFNETKIARKNLYDLIDDNSSTNIYDEQTAKDLVEFLSKKK